MNRAIVPTYYVVLGIDAGLLASLRFTNGHGWVWALVAGAIYATSLFVFFKWGRHRRRRGPGRG